MLVTDNLQIHPVRVHESLHCAPVVEMVHPPSLVGQDDEPRGDGTVNRLQVSLEPSDLSVGKAVPLRLVLVVGNLGIERGEVHTILLPRVPEVGAGFGVGPQRLVIGESVDVVCEVVLLLVVAGGDEVGHRRRDVLYEVQELIADTPPVRVEIIGHVADVENRVVRMGFQLLLKKRETYIVVKAQVTIDRVCQIGIFDDEAMIA
mmetsp:Transcript_34475/g.80595  ORF Transcript_34475/g.80595 Transcript_34475/m.80595 type:complete len:204 (+) Transcript_34475:414-1025(+)